jgi:RNA polymerase sigma factor (sigma-70 family)
MSSEELGTVLLSYKNGLLAYLCNHGLEVDPFLAEDIFYTVVERTLRYHRDGPRPIENLGTFMYRIAINLAMNKGSAAAKESDVLETYALRCLPDGDPINPELALERKREADAVRRAMGALPSAQRAAVQELQLHGKTGLEAAQALGVKHSSLRVQLNRALHALRQNEDLRASRAA